MLEGSKRSNRTVKVTVIVTVTLTVTTVTHTVTTEDKISVCWDGSRNNQRQIQAESQQPYNNMPVEALPKGRT